MRSKTPVKRSAKTDENATPVVVKSAKKMKKTVEKKAEEEVNDWNSLAPPPALEEEEEIIKPIKKPRTASIDTSSTATAGPTVPAGTVVTGRLDFSPPPMFKAPLGTVAVQFSTAKQSHLWGKVDITDLFDEKMDQPLSKVKNGQFVKCIVLKPAPAGGLGGKANKWIDLSMRSSLVESKKVDEEYTLAFDTPAKVGDEAMHSGYIVSTTKAGCFVRINRGLTCRVMLKNLAHGFVNNAEFAFPFGKLVEGRFVSMTTEGKVEMDLRPVKRLLSSSEEISPGVILQGKVEAVINPGVLIKLAKNDIVGLCHYSECFDEVPQEIANKKLEHGQVGKAYRPLLAQHFALGSKVKCKVLSVDKDTQKLALGMKPQYFENVESDNDEEEEEEDVADAPESDEDEEEEDYQVEEAKPTISLQQAMKEIGVKAPVAKATAVRAAEDDENASGSEDDDDEERGTRNLNSKRREALKRKAEQTTALLEDRIVEDAAPNSTDEFERALVSNKTSSLLWIQYISFLVSVGEPIANVRQVAKRALDAIGPVLETEFQNVFSAWLTLEVAYGKPDTFTAVFQDMCKRCDEEWAHLTMCNTLIDSKLEDKSVRVEEAFKKAKRATKQQSCKVWMREFEYYLFDVGNANQARVVFKEAIRLMQKKDKQIELMLAFARLEFAHEPSSDRGPQILEKLLETYPKRVDFWNVYIDLQVKHRAVDKARDLFSRVLALKLSAKKMKSFFKKWLEFETEHGNDEQIELVKQKAREYVEQL